MMNSTNQNRIVSAYTLKEEKLIQSALCCLEKRIKYCSDVLTNPGDVNSYLRLQLGRESNEIFAVLFLDNVHRVIAFEKLFFGTINSTSVYPRVVLQRAIALNAAAVIFSHNHPSGSTEPSQEDKLITQRLKQVLSIVDIRVLDHVIVSQEGSDSFVQRGLL